MRQELPDRTAVAYDPHPMWLDAVSAVLRGEGFVEPVCTVTEEKALAEVARLQPMVLVTSLGTSESIEGGTRVIRRARELSPETKVVVLGQTAYRASVAAAFDAGAAAYVLKSAEAADFAAAVRQALEPSLFLAVPRAVGVAPIAPAERTGSSLTRREVEILRLVAEGHSNNQLARMLWVTEQTVKFHLSNVYRKLGVSNRTEAARWAQMHGLLPEGADAFAVA